MYQTSEDRWFRARVATPHLSRPQTRFILLLLDPYCIPLWGKDAAEAPPAFQAAREGRAGKDMHSKGLLGGPAQHTCLILLDQTLHMAHTELLGKWGHGISELGGSWLLVSFFF